MEHPVRLRPRRELTAAQELIWTSQRLHPDVPLANMANVTRLRGSLDPVRFVAAVEQVVAGSDALRLRVAEVDGVPNPTIAETPPVATEVVELPIEQLDAWCAARIATPLEIARCVYDSVLIRHGPDDWSWWMDIHHIATDAASSALVFRGVAAAYEGRWEPLGRYEDLAAELARQQASERWQAAADHWAAFDVSSGPTRLYRPDAGADTRAERRIVPMTVERQRALDALNADRFRLISPDLSLTVTLATAIATYLYRLNESEQIVIGLPIHHRSSREAKATIGPLVELFPVRIDIEAGDTFASLHERATRAVFAVLGRALPGTSPRQDFDVVLNVHAATFGRFGDLATNTRWFHPGHIDSHHRLRVQALDYDGSGRLELALDINHRIADADHRRRAADHFGAVLDAMVADPDRSIRTVPLVTADERLLLSGFARSGAGTPLDVAAPALIRRQLLAEPDRPVVFDGDDSLTAREVDRRIDRVSAALRHAGVGPGDRVGIELPIGTDAVIAIHAVLRARAAFVPIDPQYPEARRDHLRDDSGCRLTIRSLDQLDPAPAGMRAPAVEDVELDDLAYIIYTSGSTGLPKGVPITHRGLAEYLGFAHGTYIDAEPPVMPLYTSLSFDLTITTLFLPWLASGAMTIHHGGGLPALREIVDQRHVTLMKATPSHLELLVRMLSPDHPLRSLIVGGEAFHTDLADRLLAVGGAELAIFNEYGPTEAVVGCMIHRYDPDADPGPEVPIGRPAPGVGLHVLDSAGHPVPLGAEGELFISRPGLASGYHNRPELSRERFLIARDGSRLYRSGDRVRMLDADRMVYLGRIDDQIKVAGVRIEPGEIEAAAFGASGVRRAVAGLWTPRPTGAAELCVRCGLGSDVPGVTIDGDGVCSSCHDFELVAPQAEAWFRTEDDLATELEDARRRTRGEYDVIHLLSGGKDSTYALYRLVEMGARVRALTLDNGYISEGAKANVRRAVTALGVDHEFVTVDGMAEIFRDSLERHSNVCNGCYKAIYTVALARAHELGIPAIVTGLSRGQFFETRLVPGLFEADRFDPRAIDAAVDEARRVYHATRDAVSEHLDTEFLADGTVLDEVRFIDFYRFVDVELAEMYRALESSGTWERPADTGRSTNCLINAAGIYVHKLEQGHHNYALPYSWDVRLGHKTRAEALEELDDPMDAAELASITSMLADVGYEPRSRELLTLWYEGDDVDPDHLRQVLAATLPAHAVPTAIERLDAIPLTRNGKVDMTALPAPGLRRNAAAGLERPPRTPTERLVAGVWEQVLGFGPVAATDDFFALGGASLHALEMIVRVSDACGVTVPESLAFRHRTLAALADAIDSLEPSTAAPDTTIPDLPPAERPLSSGEEAMLFEWRRDPEDVRYNVARLYHLPAGYDRNRFDEAVRRVVAHQPVLHTSYGPGRALLAVEDAVAITDHTGEPGDLGDLARRINRQPFDLVAGPLVTVHHLRSSAEDWAELGILIRTHHIVSDAGSLDVLWEQIDDVYGGQPLPVLDTSYAAHAMWQRGRMPDPAGAWPVESRASVGELALRAEAAESDGYVHRTASVTAGELERSPGRTTFATALTALAAALRPYHSSSSFEVAITSTVRDHPAVAPVVGYFLNPLPLLIDVDRAGRASDLGDHVDDVLAAALPYRAVPFAAIARSARERGVPPPESRVMLAVEDLAPASLGGDTVQHEILASGRAVNDLTFFVQIRGERLELGVEYRGSVIERRQATTLLDAFDDALARLCREPDMRVSGLSPGIAPHRGPRLRGPTELVPSRIAAQIERPIARAAVTSGARRLTYVELDQDARALAARLRAVGVGPGDRVAVVVPRSIELPVAIWATWMLGASYVPIDAAHPAPHVAELVAAAGVAAAVTAGSGHAGLGEVTTVAADVADRAVLPISRLHPVEPSDEAYVIFTSGSTGQPKGVSITHGNLAASVAARLQWYGDVGDPGVERYLLLSSAGFDSSVAGLFWTLAEGGELVIPTEDEVHDVDRLLELIDTHRPTHTLCVPSLYGALLQRCGAALPGLRTVIVAGEACPRAVAAHHHSLSSAALVNEYGPTEATVWATAHLVGRGESHSTVPIGGPIPGVTVRIVDRDGVDVPDDVGGELLIGGPTVAAGYLRAADEHAEQGGFVDGGDGATVYRTGDRVVRRRSGVIEFLGRLDDQLSIGGVRVEPAEVERALAEFPGITDALVAERGGRMVAWVEGAPGIDTGRLRAELRQRVAATHVPTVIARVDELPRTTNGKVDRRAAADLALDAVTGTAAEPVVESDPLTAAVLECFRQAFDGDAFGADDDFFDRGGDSLRAVVLVSLLETELRRRIPIGTLVEAPTPRSLARHLATDENQPSEVGASTVRTSSGLVEWLRRSGSQPPLVVLPPGGGNLLRYQPLVGALHEDVPVVGIRLPGADALSDVVESVEGQAAAMLRALDGAVEGGPYRLLGWSTGGLIAWEMTRLLLDRGDEVEFVALVDTVMGGRHVDAPRSPIEKYAEMLRDDGLRAAVDEGARRARERAEFSVARLRYRAARRRGETPSLPDAERQLGPVIRRASLAYVPEPLAVPTIYLAASESGTELTVEPWSALQSGSDGFSVVTLEGTHFLPEDRCIIGPQRIDELVAALPVPGAADA